MGDIAYDHLPFSKVAGPLMESPPCLNNEPGIQVPDSAMSFVYDFSVEREAIKEAEEIEISELTEIGDRKKREEQRKKKREAEELERQARLAERRAEFAKRAEDERAVSQLRQKSVERDREEEQVRKIEEENRRKALEENKASRKVSMPSRPFTTQEEKQRTAIRQFMTWTGASEEECRHYLTAYNWDLQKSVSNYYGRD